VINKECRPSCTAKFEIVAGCCAFELTFESNQEVVSRRNAVTNPITGTQMFFRLKQ
jgi:hypothetical protein